MADNERVVIVSNDLDPQQQSVAQANRTEWYPGKATSREGDMNWERDKRIPQGTPAFGGEAAGPVEMNRTRVVKLHRNTVSDQVLHGNDGVFPHTEAPETTVIDDDATWGTGPDPEHTVTPVEENEADGRYERHAGNDNIKGA